MRCDMLQTQAERYAFERILDQCNVVFANLHQCQTIAGMRQKCSAYRLIIKPPINRKHYILSNML